MLLRFYIRVVGTHLLAACTGKKARPYKILRFKNVTNVIAT